MTTRCCDCAQPLPPDSAPDIVRCRPCAEAMSGMILCAIGRAQEEICLGPAAWDEPDAPPLDEEETR